MKKIYIFVAFILINFFALPVFAQTCMPGGPCGTTGYIYYSTQDIWRIPPAEQNHEELRQFTQNNVDTAGKNADLAKMTDAEKKKQKCKQMLLDVEAVQAACVSIENNTATALAYSCPNLTYTGGYTAGGGRYGSVSAGVNYNSNCEARMGFNLAARIADCNFSASVSKAAIGSCE